MDTSSHRADRAFDVFLAHNAADARYVDAIAAALKERGIRAWVSSEQIPPGRSFQQAIQEQIKHSRCAAILVGQHGLGRWQALELHALISECVNIGVPVIPVLLPGTDELPGDLLFLRELNWVKFGTLEDQRALDLLVWGITGSQSGAGRVRPEDDSRDGVEDVDTGRSSSDQFSGDSRPADGVAGDSAGGENSSAPAFDEAPASRAYLQRAEVRLSTLHRIAGVFLNGAGLLVLFPVLVTQIVGDLIQVLSLAPFELSARCSLVAIVGLVSMLPVYSLLLLFKELVQFYYVTRHDDKAGDDLKRFFPRFTLTGLALPPDETADSKRAILGIQYSGRFTDFLIPRHPRRRHYYTQVQSEFRSALPPLHGRTLGALAELRVPVRVPLGELEILGTALRLTGFDDRPLAEEVAKTEFSIARHLVYLRTLVIRYFKSLILLIISTLVLALASGIAPKFVGVSGQAPGVPCFFPSDLSGPTYVLSFLFFAWSFLVVYGARRPIEWIYELADPAKDVGGTHEFDPELVRFENAVKFVAIFVGVLSVQTALGHYLGKSLPGVDLWLRWITGLEAAAWVALGFHLRARNNRRYRHEVGR